MTIDELINHEEEILKEIQDLGLGSTEYTEAVIDGLKGYKWYIEQDLIPRKDALERIENLKRLERHPDHVITLHHSYLAIMEIPKAEPPKE